ncbi:MAG: adenosylcobalamin-dependent ribonucleoside-diphosphate reductase [Gammaproteobacteria bacterium]
MELSPQTISIEVLQSKYCKGSESTIPDVQRRVARALAAVEKSPDEWEPVFLDAMRRGMVMAGRINSAAGTTLQATWINCFVQPVGDAISGADEGGFPGIYEALREATETMRRGGGVGYDFSRLRPRGAHVATTNSEASGPVSYMRVFDRSCETVESAGARRGAQMGILRIDHPDVREFVHAKDKQGELANFNISVAVTNAFMEAVRDDTAFQLVHQLAPGARRRQQGVSQRTDGMWVYETVKARDLWNEIMVSTYDHGEPGVFFIDRVNEDNNLYYCEIVDACNPCAEQCLPAYGCCCLGSIDLTRFVTNPFRQNAAFDYQSFGRLARTGVRMLDNVLDGTSWPLQQQRTEAMNKRRIGLGFLGLGSSLVMLGWRYDSDEGRAIATRIAKVLRDEAYRASIELAQERGPFPLFNPQQYLSAGFARRLPEDVREGISTRGIRNSHLLSIAPTGTISLAFADNASNGIEPAFSWSYDRKKRTLDGDWEIFPVYDHAYRLWREQRRNAGESDREIIEALPDYFVSALEISAEDHGRMVAVVQEYIDSSISKTVNVRADYPFEDFKDLYMSAWSGGAKSLATFRPNEVTGELLSASKEPESDDMLRPHKLDESDPDRRIVIDKLPTPTLNSLRWPRRPDLPNGNNARCYRVKHPHGQKFALFIGEIQDGRANPFEVWVNGIEAPRGLNALAINLSYDMYAEDRGWLKKKLESLMMCESDDEAFPLPMPPQGKTRYAPSIVAAMAMLIEYRCRELGVFDRVGETPILNALMSPKEPRAGPDGTMSWTVDVSNPNTGDDFVLGLKEAVIEIDGVRQLRPYSMWLSNVYPKALDGLCKALSLDMRVVDPAWVGKKLRELLNYAEPKGDFWAPVPGLDKQYSYPSTVAYIARLVIHRFAMLGILDEDGYPMETMGIVQSPEPTTLRVVGGRSVGAMEVMPGKLCRECGMYAVILSDGCERCTSCGEIGNCG